MSLTIDNFITWFLVIVCAGVAAGAMVIHTHTITKMLSIQVLYDGDAEIIFQVLCGEHQPVVGKYDSAIVIVTTVVVLRTAAAGYPLEKSLGQPTATSSVGGYMMTMAVVEFVVNIGTVAEEKHTKSISG